MSDRRFSFERDPATRAIDEQAAEWFGRCEIGLTPDEERAFVQWLELDPRHGEAFREMDDTWDVLDRLKHSQKLRAHAPLPSASAAPKCAPAPVVSFFGIRRTSWPALLAAAAAIALAFITLRPERETPAIVRQVATEVGGMKQMELPDGSVIHLNASSRVAVLLTAAERRVELLEGEAHFTVAKDPDRPFVVHAGAVAVRAVGTAFNVRRAAQAIEVFVTEGRVRLDDNTRGKSLLLGPRPPPIPATAAGTSPVPPSASPSTAQPDILVAGQRAVVALSLAATPTPAVIDAITEPDMQRALAWRARQLEFDLTPLADVAAEFNRYNTHQLVIGDPELARETFGGSFRADNYDVFVQLLEKRFNVTAERGPESTTLRRAR